MRHLPFSMLIVVCTATISGLHLDNQPSPFFFGIRMRMAQGLETLVDPSITITASCSFHDHRKSIGSFMYKIATVVISLSNCYIRNVLLCYSTIFSKLCLVRSSGLDIFLTYFSRSEFHMQTADLCSIREKERCFSPFRSSLSFTSSSLPQKDTLYRI